MKSNTLIALRTLRTITLIIATSMLLSGCLGIFGERKVTTQVVKVQTPVLYSPKPPLIDRPDLLIHDMTIDQRNDAGSVAKYYKATVLQLLGYVEQLEEALDSYNVISETLDESGVVISNGTEVDVSTE